jgi:Predicted hydrolase (metallo-beta-lactamase superfamily)
VDVILPKPQITERQRRVFDALYRNESVDAVETFMAAKQRNLSSLMLRFGYAGRSVLITGDRYAADWEDEKLGPVDVLKLPHHGDPKSMTPALLDALEPSIAVISCQSDPRKGKDRPNEQIVQLLKGKVPKLYCTENRALESLAASTHNGVRIVIGDDGTVAAGTE